MTEFVHNIGGVGILETPLLGMEGLVGGAATGVWNLLGGSSGWEQHSNGYCAMLFCRCPYPDSSDCRLVLDFVIVKNVNVIIAVSPIKLSVSSWYLYLAGSSLS